jgi:hypothetical protein
MMMNEPCILKKKKKKKEREEPSEIEELNKEIEIVVGSNHQLDITH